MMAGTDEDQRVGQEAGMHHLASGRTQNLEPLSLVISNDL